MQFVFQTIGLMLLLGSSLSARQIDPYGNAAPPVMKDLLSVKETFRYEVKYGFFKLGELTLEISGDTLYNGKIHHILHTEIVSNSSIPFIDEEEDYFNSFFYVNDAGLPVESLYWKNNVDENKPREIVYKFDREKGLVYYKEEDNTRDTLKLEEPATSGHVIFYFSRLFAGTNKNFKLPVYVTKKKGYIYGKNSIKMEKREYDAFSGPIQAYRMNGSTEDIDGPFGFSGDFTAWFMADELRVPVEARVRVFLGNVKVKLVEYSREQL